MRGRAFVLLTIAVVICGVVAIGERVLDRGRDDVPTVVATFLALNESGRLQSGRARSLLAGEAAEAWSAPSLDPAPASADRIVYLDDSRAVAAGVDARNGRERDVYLYLDRTDRWRITAMRTTPRTEIIESALRAAAERDDPRPPAVEAMLDEMRLALLTDSQLESWFRENRATIQRLIEAADSTTCTVSTFIRNEIRSPVPATPSEADGEAFIHGGQMYVEELLRELHVTSVTYEPGGDVYLELGSVLDDTVYILHSPRDDPPPIDPSAHIWVQKLEPRWYLCRKT